MELVYLWVDKYKNIYHQGFNFSGQYRCDFDLVKHELTIDENKEYVHIFPKNINVTAIVGKNGSGKSTLSEIINTLGSNQNYLRGITIYVENNIYKITSIAIEEFQIVCKFPCEYQIERIENILSDHKQAEKFPIYKGTTFFYSSSPFDKNYRFIDNKSKFLYLGFFDKNGSFGQADVISQSIENIIYLLKNTDKAELNLLKLNYSQEFQLIPREIAWKDIEEIFIDFHNNEAILKFINRAYTNVKYNKKDSKKAFLLVYFWIYLLYGENGEAWVTQDIYNELVQDFEITNLTFDMFLNKISLFLQKNKHDNLLAFIEKFIEISNQKLSIQTPRLNLFRYFWVNINNIDNDFLEIMKKILLKDLFELSWIIDGQDSALSAGEIVILDMLGKLHRVLNKQNDSQSTLIIFDEIESLLHPEWQKKYMYILLNTVLLHSKSTITQIIFNTHSPFVLSDIPKENIIFLENGEQRYPFDDNEQTFGANIHTLLSHGFFMSEGLMGEFAKEKIQDVINFLNNEESKIQSEEDAWKIIQIIGEPFLKYKLEEKFHENYSSDKVKNEAKIKRLEEEIKRLKNVKPKG